MGKLKQTTCLVGVTLAGVALGAQSSAWGETLQDALIAAYNSNPTLLADRARQRATDENANQARAGWKPTVTINGSYTITESQRQIARFLGNSTSVEDNDYTEGYAATVVATQPIFRGGRNFFSTKSADAQVRAGRAALTDTEQQVFLSVVTSYMDVIRDRATVNLRKNNVGVLTRQLQASRDRFRVGEITRTDVSQSEARLSGARANLSSAEAQLARSLATYEQIVGVTAGSLDGAAQLPPLPKTLEEAIKVAMDNNPNIMSAKETETAAKYDVKDSAGALLPQLEIQGTVQKDELTNRDDSQNYQATATAQVSMPIYQAGTNYSAIRQTKHVRNQRRLQVAETQRSVVQSTTTAWNNLIAARASIVANKEQVRANTVAFEGVQQEAQVGSRTTLDVLDAEQELLDSRVALVAAERDEYVTAYQLLSAVGALTAHGLELPTDIYDPVKNYNDVRWKFVGFGASGD